MKQNPKKSLLAVRHLFHEFMKKGDFSSYNELIAENVVVHCPASWQQIHPIEIEGIESTRQIDQEYGMAFHFGRVDICENLFFEEKVLVRWDCEGYQKGSFYGLQAGNQSFSLEGQSLYHFDTAGRITEVWQSWDMLGLLNQLGWNRARSEIRKESDRVDQLKKKLMGLTQRERECLKLLAYGKTAKETGAQLFVSPRTVEYYFENIKNKLNLATKKELIPFLRLLERHELI